MAGVRGRHKSRGGSLVSGLCMGLKAEIRTPGKGKMMVARVYSLATGLDQALEPRVFMCFFFFFPFFSCTSIKQILFSTYS